MNLLLAAAGIASMTAAMARGDVDEAARQGVLAGPVVVEKALHSSHRATRLAGIAAAPTVTDAAELLPDLADLAAAPDRRTAGPAIRAARTIANGLRRRELADDLAAEDIEAWRATFEAIARQGTHPAEVRVIALEVCVSLAHVVDPGALGFDAAAFAADPDRDVARAAAELARPLTRPSRRRSTAAEALIVPSQRLLKMLDPLGHLVPERALASHAPKAVVWAPTPLVAVWIRDELAAAGIEALQATHFRHIASSLRASARPAITLAVVELAATTEADLSTLVTARWAGFRGPLVGVGARDAISAKSRLLLGLELVALDPDALRDIAMAIRER